jgi:putative transposase
MIAFIDDQRASYGVEPICRVLPIAPSTYHAHVAQRLDAARLSLRARGDVMLMEEVSMLRTNSSEVLAENSSDRLVATLRW